MRIRLIVAAIFIAGLYCLSFRRTVHKKVSEITDQKSALSYIDASNAPRSLPISKRKGAWREERLTLLESLGELPIDADAIDWQIATKASWWGNHIDPNVFWSNRPVWLDASTMLQARRHGRMFPPIPSNKKPSSNRSGAELIAGGGSESGGLPFHYTEEEDAFWDNFVKNKPRPPDDISRKQFEVERRILQVANGWPGATSTIIDQTINAIQTQPVTQLNYPAEAFSSSALYWSYIEINNQKYQELVNSGNAVGGSAVGSFLREFSSTNLTYITNAVPPEGLQTINSWRLSYVNRLRQQDTDPIYINAYLKSWNLPAK